MENHGSEYRSRNFVGEHHDRLVQDLLRQIAEAEAKTDPVHGEASATGKDREAFFALRTAGDLVEAVAGWAIDHVCGLSLDGANVLPPQPIKSKQHPEFFQSRQFADRHEHEKAGGEVALLQASLTAEQKRILLRNLLFCGSMAGPDWLRDEAFQALDALAFGEAVPMLAAAETHAGSKVRYRELRAQLKLIAIVRFRKAAYSGAAEAFDFVAGKVGVSPDTLRTWEKRLREELGRLEVSRTIEFATNGASHVKHANDRRNRGFALTRSEAFQREWHEGRYGVAALDVAVEEYRKIKADA